MDEQRIEAYLNLTNALILNRENEAEFDKIWNDNQELLIDSGLWQTMFQETQRLASADNQDRAKFLLKMANYLKSRDYTNFLIELLRAAAESMVDSKVVYPILEKNLDKLDNYFANILRNWATAKFSKEEADVAENIAINSGHNIIPVGWVKRQRNPTKTYICICWVSLLPRNLLLGKCNSIYFSRLLFCISS